MTDADVTTRAQLRTLLAAAGLASDGRLAEDLLPTHRATRRLLDRLDALDLGDAEPATVFRWPAELAGEEGRP